MFFIADFNPYCLTKKTCAGYCCHLQSSNFRFSLAVRITSYYLRKKRQPSSIYPFPLKSFRHAATTSGSYMEPPWTDFLPGPHPMGKAFR